MILPCTHLTDESTFLDHLLSFWTICLDHPNSASLPHAEVLEDVVEDIIGGNLADDGTEVVETLA